MFAEAPTTLARAYDVRQQSSWTAIGADGVIVRSRGYGAQGAGYWRGVLDQLRAG